MNKEEWIFRHAFIARNLAKRYVRKNTPGWRSDLLEDLQAEALLGIVENAEKYAGRECADHIHEMFAYRRAQSAATRWLAVQITGRQGGFERRLKKLQYTEYDTTEPYDYYTPHARVEHKGREPWLWDTLRRVLTPEQYKIVTMRIEDKTWTEIGKEIGCQREAARMRWQDTIKPKLRRALGEYDDG